jgi:hypothetical protein
VMNWKECGRKLSWPIFKVLSPHLTGGTEENHKRPQVGWCPDRDLNPGHPEYETGMLSRYRTLLKLRNSIRSKLIYSYRKLEQ